MQFCPSAELTAAACLGCSCSAINCSNMDADFCVQELQNPPKYRVDRTNFALSRDSGKMKFITNNFAGTKKDAIKKKYHAYRSIWNCNQFGLERDPNSKNKSGSKVEVKTIKWKFWPPPMVPVPKGLKIPVQYVREINTPISNDPCSPTESTPDSKRYYVAGEDEVVNLIKAQPQEELPNDYYLQGVLNKPESEFFLASPTKLLFFGTEVGQTYTTTIKVLNNGVIPRHISVLNPRNASIDIDWGAGIGENTLVAPGLCHRILITFRPKTKEAIHDTIAIIVSDDGAIIIPVISEHLAPPILEMVEWDVGCCIVGKSRVVNFDITSRGGEGRFWILSEEEFLNETIDIPFLPESRLGVEILRIRGEIEELQKIGARQLTAEESGQLKRLKLEWSELLIGKTSELPAKPFLISPSCFRLQKSQFITIKIQYRPGDPDYHIRKLVLLCDNGEVRWIALKGIGIDKDKFPLVDIQGKWMAPPIDLPADLNTRLTINCGDLIAGETNSQGFTIKNNSCMPLYFFWAVRHLRVLDEPLLQTETGLDSSIMEQRREGLTSVEWEDYSDISTEQSHLCSSLMPLKISPAQNIIEGHQVLGCVVTVHAPPKEGFYVTVISLFVQQLNESEEKILSSVLTGLDTDSSSSSNNDPITYESITQTLPAKIYKKDISKQNKMNSNKRNSANSASMEMEGNPTNTTETISINGKGDGPDVGIEMESGAGTILESNITLLLPQFSKDTDTITHRFRCNLTKSHIQSVPFYHITPNEENPNPPYDYKLVHSDSRTFVDLEDGINAEGGDPYGCKDFDGGQLNLNDARLQIANINFSQDQGKKLSCRKISSSPFSPLEEYGEEEEEVEEDSNKLWSRDLGEDAEGLFDLSTEYDPGEGYYDSFEVKEEPKTSEIAEALAKEGCVLAHQYRNSKSWLDVTSPLQPIEEIEVWLQTIPLQCSFEPPHISGYGTFSNKVIRTIEFVNHTAYPVQLSMSHFVSSVGTITCRPYEASVESLQSILLRFTLDFRTHGNHEGKIKGTIKLPFATVPCWVPFRLQAQGPQLLIVTPFINFGLVLEGTEKSKTLVLKNNGSLRTKWYAKIRSTNLRDENLSELSFDNAIVEKERLIRAWPECGTIEAYETVSIQIYLSADFGYTGSLSAACEITNEENPEDICYVTVLAHVQSTQVIVRNSKVLLQDAFIHLPNYSASTNLQNLTTFSTPFKWLPPIGGLLDICSVTVAPSEGILPPRGSVTCVFQFLCNQSLLLTNLFIPCCVGGMKEPLLVKIEGTVFGACLKIVIPVTKFYRVREEDLPWHCHDDLWPRICGMRDGDEVPGEGEDEYYTNFLGMKYCVAKHETQAPPPSVIEPEVEEEEEAVDEGDSRVSDSEATDTDKNRKRSKWKKSKRKKSVKPDNLTDDKRPESKKGKRKSKLPIPQSVLEDESGDKETPEEIVKTTDLDSVDEAESLEPSLFDVDSLMQKSGETEFLGEDDIGASFFENLLAEDDDNPDEVMRSGERQIYLQIRKSGDIALVIFTVQNEAPMSTKYNFKVVNHPIQTPAEVKQPDFVLLDDDFFQLMSYNLKEQEPKDDVLKGKFGAAFRVSPSEGILEPTEMIEVTLEFHANLSGIYEDQLECHFEGMENPYIIKIEALAVICDQKASLPVPACTPPVVVPPKDVGKMC